MYISSSQVQKNGWVTNCTDNETTWEGGEQSFVELVEDGFILVVD
jgi:hypothetical protein